MSKNLIPEMMYAIAFRIQELAMMLLRLVNEALYAKPYGSPRDYDPATILCALWIVYSSVKKFRKLRDDWEFAGIAKLVRSSPNNKQHVILTHLIYCRKNFSTVSTLEHLPQLSLSRGTDTRAPEFSATHRSASRTWLI
jgi:hypothetical protein